jgi:arginyl-tRNA synthetase
MKHDSLQQMLSARFAAALAQVAGTTAVPADGGVRPAGDPRFGDYQCNAAMGLAKTLQSKPREVAERITAAVGPLLGEMVEPLEVAGPGFINIRLRNEYLARYLAEIPAPEIRSHVPTSPHSHADADRVGLAPVEHRLRVVVEYSQPNIAKQMHVGHLRGTIIGDVFARVLTFEGHDVVRQNHIGDWGTQFGMLIRWYRDHRLPTAATHTDVLEAIEDDYRAAQEQFKQDPAFADEARLCVGQLQSGDPAARHVWEQICAESWRAFTAIYERLGVLLTPDDVRGESFYNDHLEPLVAGLRQEFSPAGSRCHSLRAEVRDDQGAVCVFMYDEQGAPRFKAADDSHLPMIIQKSDGAYLYATTDLAAIRFRLRELEFATGRGAQRVIYVTDARQKLHFQMFFECARLAGWVGPDVSVEHVTYGSVLGTDRRPLKTRDGKNVKLRELLDEAEVRAYELLRSRHEGTELRPTEEGGRRRHEEPEAAVTLADEEEHVIARRVGIAAVKYADLCRDRNGDYVFSWDTMLAMQGNTAPYMMYAYARIRSIYRKAVARSGTPDVYAPDVKLVLAQPTERALALRLARLREAIDDVAGNLTPHTLCAYLYELAADFMRFYESCPVLTAADDAARLSRLRLCDLAARTLRLGLGLLGIEVIERM